MEHDKREKEAEFAPASFLEPGRAWRIMAVAMFLMEMASQKA
jgi:hypothetical protein